MCCVVVWCGVVWCGVVWCGVVWCVVLCCVVLCCIVDLIIKLIASFLQKLIDFVIIYFRATIWKLSKKC